MLSLLQFRSLFPEFQKTPDDLVQSRLDQAAARLDPGVWGSRFDQAHGLLAAHLLAVSPFGQAARLVTEKGESTYGRQYKELVPEVVSLTFRVP